MEAGGSSLHSMALSWNQINLIQLCQPVSFMISLIPYFCHLPSVLFRPISYFLTCFYVIVTIVSLKCVHTEGSIVK